MTDLRQSDRHQARLILEAEAVQPACALTALREPPVQDACFLDLPPTVADYAAVAADIGYTPPHLPNLQLQEWLGETGVRVLDYEAVCKWMDQYVYPLDASWFWCPLRPKDAESRDLDGYTARGRDRNGHTHGQTNRYRVYVNSGKDVPIHILERVRRIEQALAERGFATPVRFFVSDFEVRKPIPREREAALTDPFLMAIAAVAAPAALLPLVIGQWNEPCLVDPDPDDARYARAAARRQGHRLAAANGERPARAAAAVAAARLAARLPVALPLLPAAVAHRRSTRWRVPGLTVWEWAMAAAFLLTLWACR
jgi:hypothetical protein